MHSRAIALAAAAAVLFLTATAPARAEDAPSGGAWMDCQVSAVAAYRDRLVVKCGGVAGGEAPRQFAVELVDRLADIVLRLSIEAKGKARPLGILYVKDAAANPAGCVADGCRRIAAVELK